MVWEMDRRLKVNKWSERNMCHPKKLDVFDGNSRPF